MGRFTFSGDLESVRERQLDFISDILQKKGFNGPEVTLENVGGAGDNYMSSVKRVIITENGTTFKMIAKLAPDSQMMRITAQIDILFKNEIVIYTELLPKFIQIQKTAGVDELFRFAECYGALDEAPNEVILLEDLKESQFEMQDRFEPLSVNSVKIVLKNLAVYHSLSYVLKHQNLNKFNEIKSKLGDMFDGAMSQSEDTKKYFKFLEDTTIAMLVDDRYKKYVKGSVSEMFNVYQRTKKGDLGSKQSVIQQGDGWINNIMFRNEDGEPSECIFIDYQLSRESNPAYDIMYMLFNSTTHQQRLENYYDFIDHYHRELDESLYNYGLKANLVYPRDQLDSDLKRFGKVMFATSVMVTNSILKKAEDAEKMKEVMNMSADAVSDEMMEGMFAVHHETATLFRSRVEGLVDSFVEFGLL